MLIMTPSDVQIPLGEIARLDIASAPSMIRDEAATNRMGLR